MGRRDKGTGRRGRGKDASSITPPLPHSPEQSPAPSSGERIAADPVAVEPIAAEPIGPPAIVGHEPLAHTEPTSSTNRRSPFMKRFDTRRAVLWAVVLPLAVLALTVGLARQQIARVGIDGSWNHRAAVAYEVTADVSSSAQNLTEAYLVARQLTLETDAGQVKALSDRLDQLEARYRDRHLYWNAVLTSGPLHKSLVIDADQAGTEFWKAVREGLLPLTRGTDLAARRTVLSTRIDPPFNRQQTALKIADQQAAGERAAAAADGAAAADRARNLLLTMLGVGLIAALVAVLVTPRLARRPIRRLQEREADAAARLRATDPSTHELPVIEPVVADTRDLGDLADTFNSLVRTSIEGLESQIETRKANEQLFISLGRRSQNLVGRQIRFIDQLEQHEADPDALAALFQMDHLATRMRRNAESLLVIAGLDSPRAWKNPAPALEVAHAAASETEQYTRVQFGPIPSTAIQGGAIANVVHLLAELIDNALRYSPPETSVVVSASTQEGRLLFAVTDGGMGMSAGDLKVVNGRLSGEALNDRSPAPQLGLTVVARLAARHNIGIRLAPTGAQGLTAWVELPPNLLVASTVPQTFGCG
ncbi:MAG: hypothetical protein QOJ19_4208, partial [Acidimicrobiia bacterium]|nr:hypothetical protein [Acidimicrobiia bacterium]